MKNQFNKLALFLLISIFSIINNPSYAATIDVTPMSPDINDFIVANIYGTYGTPGFTLNSTQLNIANNFINIDLFVTAPSGPVIQVITPFSYFVDIGLLSAGTYSITADIIIDGTPTFSANNTFTVSPVPIPASILLFFSGLVVLLSFRKNHRKA